MEPKVIGGLSESTPRTISKMGNAILPTEVITADGLPYTPTIAEDLLHSTAESWVRAILECRTCGEIVVHSDVRRLLVGFIHYPSAPEAKTIHHLLRLSKLRENPEAFQLLGLNYESFRALVKTEDGWVRLITGKDPEQPEGLEENCANLSNVMMLEGIQIDVGADEVKFP